ncbi:MAG: DUF4956 domain-containing protein [Anaerolineaceae bacterium]|nr:DUF4956 domain-containing protein [Anaerolineaceae bacterium]
MATVVKLLLSFLLNFFTAFVIVRFIYYPKTKDREYVFTFLTFNTVIFFVLSLLGSINLSVGFGFGLFGIFSVLRYRTNPIPIREMTYLFVTIALPVMNSILVSDNGFAQVLLANLLILLVLFAVERSWGFKFVSRKTIVYEKIELIKPECEQLLLDDLHERTGLTITGVKVGQIDFLHDTAKLEISYFEDGVSA